MTINNPPNKHLLLLSFVIMVCLTLQAPVLFASEEDCSSRQKICFQWAFIADLKQEKKIVAVNLTKNNVLKSGDQLGFIFKLNKPCFLYLIHYGPGDEVTLLYPYALPHELPSGDMPVMYHIPENPLEFTLDDNAGKETFYMVATSMRLSELESLLMDYNESNGSKKVEMGQKIIKKVEKFNQQSSKLTAAAERPSSKIGGSYRTTVDDIYQKFQDNRGKKTSLNFYLLLLSSLEYDSLMVSANDFYIKVITIDHK